ncbi:uncharacterized protein LOC106150679 [Lingula anatina]|uniref:Uncharacterized protein LOC106150679 n=1 Tax=Lingula anatina TaxID=7574 RepID=A0A1S3GZG4_LINAN|nr:uncharacterized protein LOC106150679 [Lingula anatina]|eukprot:XP_013379067.1 uncharacterized protein LOC106150679 [Lingula anatina]
MDFPTAQDEFKDLLSRTDPLVLPKFIEWVANVYCQTQVESMDRLSEADVFLNSICDDLREEVPLMGLAPKENIVFPTDNKRTECNPETTVSVDAFLYTDDIIDQLCEEGSMSRNYCKKCLSHDTAPLTFVSHSMSKTQVKFVFQYALPDLAEKMVLDVGSRLGAVLYGAYYFSSAKVIKGVEINDYFCELSGKILSKYSLTDRVKIECSDILQQSHLLQQADVVVLNNVFEFFTSPDVETKFWLLLRENVRKQGVILVTVPSLEESFESLKVNIELSSWLRPLPLENIVRRANLQLFGAKDSEESDLEGIYLYTVL